MQVTLYGYKKCSTCRDAQKYLEQKGVTVVFRDFVATPIEEELISNWITRSSEGVGPILNTRGTNFKNRGLTTNSFSEAEWVQQLRDDGKLLKRPILDTGTTLVIGFQPNAYDAFLQALK